MSALARVTRAADPALAPHAVPDPGPDRFDGRVADPDRAFVVEAVHEGFLLHYDEPRAFAGMDPDMRLLAGDSLYALGLARLAELGDLGAVAELADLISLCAQAEAGGRRELSHELWDASAGVLGGSEGPGARAVAAGRLEHGP